MQEFILDNNNYTANDFQAKQLQLLVGNLIHWKDAIKIVNTEDLAAKQLLLERAIVKRSDFILPSQQAAAREYLVALASGAAPKARGESLQDAIVVISDNTEDGIDLEYSWIEFRFGEKDFDWTRDSQGVRRVGERVFDWIKIKTKDGKIKQVEFDITSFFGH